MLVFLVLYIHFCGFSWFCFSMYLWLAFWHTVKTKISFNGTIYSIKTAELISWGIKQQLITLWSPFLPFLLYHPFLLEDQGNPIKTKWTKTGWLLLTCRWSFQILLENLKDDFTTCSVHINVLCVDTCTDTRAVRRVSHRVW